MTLSCTRLLARWIRRIWWIWIQSITLPSDAVWHNTRRVSIMLEHAHTASCTRNWTKRIGTKNPDSQNVSTTRTGHKMWQNLAMPIFILFFFSHTSIATIKIAAICTHLSSRWKTNTWPGNSQSVLGEDRRRAGENFPRIQDRTVHNESGKLRYHTHAAVTHQPTVT